MLKTTDSGSSNGLQPGLRPPAQDGGGWVAAGPVFVVGTPFLCFMTVQDVGAL